MGMTRIVSRALPRERAEALAAVLTEAAWPAPAAVSLFEVDERAELWQAEALYETPPDMEALAEVLRAVSMAPSALRAMPVPDVDWVTEAQRRLAPVRAGHFLVHGTHDRDRPMAGVITLEIDAGQAFGTGHHGTTQGCLMALSRLAAGGFRPRRVLDVGTGTGVLAIAAAKLFRAPALATDIDPVAVAVARDNVRRNDVSALVRVVAAPGVRHADVRAGRVPWTPRIEGRRIVTSSALRVRGAGRWHEPPLGRIMPGLAARLKGYGANRRVLPDKARRPAHCHGYDLILANILAGPLRRMAGDLAACLAPGGRLVLSGLLAEQEKTVLAAYLGRGLTLDTRVCIGEWSTLVLDRP